MAAGSQREHAKVGPGREIGVSYFRWAFAVLVALLPSFLKIPFYRLVYRYQIGKGVRIGFSPLLGVRRCRIGDHVRIGSLNLFYRIADLEIGHHVRIGFLNVFRGGERIQVGDYATILRLNTFNAIIEGDFMEPAASVLDLGTGAVVTTGHWLDFSGSIQIGAHAIVGGRNSSLWTHNRQRARPVTVGCHTYLGSEVRIAPGVEISAFSIVALGSVLTGKLARPRVLIGGNPATITRDLREEDLFLVTRKTRNDMPDVIAEALLDDDLKALLRQGSASDRENDLMVQEPVNDKGSR